jgi:hypothetical protein
MGKLIVGISSSDELKGLTEAEILALTVNVSWRYKTIKV